MISFFANKNKAIFKQKSLLWLILTSMVISITLSSCANMAMVRSNSAKQKKIAKAKAEKQNPDTKKDISDNNIVELLPDSTIEDEEITEDAQPKKLLPLNEMVNNIAKDQTILNKKVENLQNDVTQMKGTLQEIRTAIMYIGTGKLPEPVKGEPVVKKQQTKSITENDTKKNDFVVLSDEASNVKKQAPITKKPQKKQSVPIKKAATPPKEKETNYSYEIKSDEEQKNVADLKVPEPVVPVVNAPAETESDFNIAMTSFAKSDYQDAIRRLSKISETEKSPSLVIDSQYWLGESYFGLKQYEKAVSYFKKVLSAKSSKQDDAQAMLGESLIRSGQVQEAKAAFQTLIQNYPGSEYVPRARKMLQQL